MKWKMGGNFFLGTGKKDLVWNSKIFRIVGVKYTNLNTKKKLQKVCVIITSGYIKCNESYNERFTTLNLTKLNH